MYTMYLTYTMYNLYTMYMYTLAEFRKNTRKAFNDADEGHEVVIERYGQLFQLVSLVNLPLGGSKFESTPTEIKPIKPLTPKYSPKKVNQALSGAKVPTANRYVQSADGKVHGPTKAWAEIKPISKAPDPNTGYPCCTKKTPCKHWAWNSDREAWVNTLTGNTREAE